MAPKIDVRNTFVLEADNSYGDDAVFRITADQVATAPIQVWYYTQPGTANASTGDYSGKIGSITIPAGQSSADLRIRIWGDTLIEGDENFDVVFYAVTNASFADDAGALRAKATILDNNDAKPDVLPAQGAPAERLNGPAAEPGNLPTIDVQDINFTEGDSSYHYARFLIMLDRPATAKTTVDYQLADGSAASVFGDYTSARGTATIEAGQQATYVSVRIYGDTKIEGDESFSLMLTNPFNAVFKEGAPVLHAEGTIIDNDTAPSGLESGLGGFSQIIDGPEPEAGLLPTLRIYDLAAFEGQSSYSTPHVLVTLDRPAPADVTFYVVANSRTTTSEDYYAQPRSYTIPAGEQSLLLPVRVYGDEKIEGDEQFSVVLTQLRNAVFENGAAALEADVRIVSDDDGPRSQDAGLGAPGKGIAGPASGSEIRIDAVETSIIERDDNQRQTVYVHVLLSEPATSDVSYRYETVGDTASSADYAAINGTLTMRAGTQSGVIPITINGDNLIEGNEHFFLRLSNPTGATLANGEATMDVKITIYDNDDGILTPGEDAPGPKFSYMAITPGATDGNNRITGTPLNDRLDALGGNDTVIALDGNDYISGGPGHDWLTPGAGADTVTGGPGTDWAIYSDAAQAFRFEASKERAIASTETDRLYGIEVIEGSAYGDTFEMGTTFKVAYADGFEVKSHLDTANSVWRLYQATLGRDPDLMGHENWTKALVSGQRGLEQAAAGFVGSAEFQNTYGALDNAGFVNLLYQNVLGRAADAGGLARWTGDLQAGASRAQVVLGFSQSAEFKSSTATAATRSATDHSASTWADDVFRLYQATLDRAPDWTGLQNWAGRLAEGRAFLSVVNGFVDSAEFKATYGTSLSTEAFVSLLYNNVLGRDPDAQGLQNWSNRLDAGMSRAEVVQGFSQSAEFRNRTAPELTTWLRDQGADRFDVTAGGADLHGGFGVDVFEFARSATGTTDIVGMESWDQLNLSTFGYATVSAARSHITSAADTTTFTDQGVTIVLHGVAAGDLSDDMILV